MRINSALHHAHLDSGLAAPGEAPARFAPRLRETRNNFPGEIAELDGFAPRHRGQTAGAGTQSLTRATSTTITILLSTFNGERFLAEQLTSFVTQDYDNWRLLWRDDGSSDRTVSIMRAFALTLPPGQCLESATSGPHLGAAPSFLLLLSEARDEQIVAFADQDDVWLPQKLARASEKISAAGDRPALYCAQQFIVNETLAGSQKSAAHTNPPKFPASLPQNIANGNTLVMNRAASALVTAIPAPEGTVHDWWSYIVIAACGGDVIFDAEPQVLYRLHKNNLIAASPSLGARAIAALQRGPLIFMTMMRRHAEALSGHAAWLTPAARADLALIQSALNGNILVRLRALKTCRRFRRRTLLENLLFTFWFLTS